MDPPGLQVETTGEKEHNCFCEIPNQNIFLSPYGKIVPFNTSYRKRQM